MANVKITDLTALSGGDVASNDVLPIVDINVDQTKKIAISDLITATSAANDFITFTQLNANLNVLDANADAIEARRVANVTVMTDADDALQARLTTNVTSFTNEDTALQARIAANTLTAASNDFITFTRLNSNINVVSGNVTAAETRLNANLDVVQDNVAALSVTLGIRGDGGTNDDVTVGTEELVFKGDTGITTAVSANVVTIDLDDTAVTAGLYGGVSGGVTNVAAVTIDATGRITNAANVSVVTDLDTIQDNVVRVQQNAASNTDAVEARRVANIAGAISTVLTSDLTASRAMVTNGSGKIAISDVTATELAHLDGVSGAIQTQIDSKIATTDSASNDFVTFTRLNANINAVSSNSAAVEARRVANIAGAVSTITTDDLTADRALISTGAGKVGGSAVTATEIGHLDGVSGAIQTQLDAKAALAGATFTGQVNMSDDLVVTGNVTVNGDTTTANSVNLIVQDRMIMLANSATGAPSADVGFLFNRGNQGNAAFFYDESASTFKLSDTKDPSSNTALSPVTASNLDVGIITAATVDATAIKQNGATLDNLIGSNVDGAISTVNDTDLTASRALVSSSGGKIEVSAVTATEIGHLDGVSGAIQTQIDSKQATITGAATTIDDADLTVSRALVSSDSGKVAVSDVTSTELGHLDGVTSAVQTQINDLETRRNANVTVAASNNAALESRRTANIAGAVSTITTSDLTASRAMVTNSSGKVAVSAVTATEIGHLDGVSSAIQTQIDGLESRRNANTVTATISDDLTITGNSTIGKGFGVGGNTVPAADTISLGTPANVIIRSVGGKGGNVIIGDATATSSHLLDIRGTANTGALTATAITLGSTNLQSNLEALAGGIAGVGDTFPTGDYGLLDTANIVQDAFAVSIGGLTLFDMKTTPTGSVDTQDLGALS